MTDRDRALLEKAGWTVECISPFEIRHKETGSFATKNAADCVLLSLLDEEEGGEEQDYAALRELAVKTAKVVYAISRSQTAWALHADGLLTLIEEVE